MSNPLQLPNPLLDVHRQAEAEIINYGPLEIVHTFGEPQAEYAAIRKGCAMLDLPQRGILELTGKDRHSFLNNLISNDLWNKDTKTGLAAGKGVYAFFLNLRGRIVADMNVLERGEATWIETDARYVDLLRTTWDRYLFTEKVKMVARLDELHGIALHGPQAPAVLSALGGADVSGLGMLESTSLRLFDVEVTVWRDDICGVPGLHLIMPADGARTVWMNLLTQPDRRVRAVGWAAFNTCRIEAGRPLLDIDFPAATPDRPGARITGEQVEQEAATTPGVLPAETGQEGRAVSYTKCYLGQEIVARMHARNQVARRIVGIRMTDDAQPIAGAEVFDASGNQIGTLTSSTISPVLSGASIGLAIVKKPHFQEGTTLRIPAEGAIREAAVVRLPFTQR